MNPLTVAVLMGGPSAEREVSLQTGTLVAQELRQTGARVTTVDVRGEDFDLPAHADVVFIALHGTFGEDGTVQQILEDRGMVYTGSGPEASARAFDKAAAKAALAEAGIPTPATASRPPLVVKPARQGSSFGVTIVHSMSQLEEALQKACGYDDKVVLEQFIRGRELTVGILGHQSLPVVEIQTKGGFFDYAAKYTAGAAMEIVPAELDAVQTARAQALARRAHECLGCRDVSRVDIMMAEDGAMFVLEVNTIPGLTANSLLPKAARAAGIEFRDLCVQLVEMALARRPVGVRVAVGCA